MAEREMARVVTAALHGLDGRRIHVEVDLAKQLPGFTIVGLPSTALRESRDRVGAALGHSGFGWPNRRITVSLAPADVRKEGAAMDLAIAVGILLASGQVPRPASTLLRSTLFLGELALDGAVRPVPAAAALALDADRLGVERIVLPLAQRDLVQSEVEVPCLGVSRLAEVGATLLRLARAERVRRSTSVVTASRPTPSPVAGQARAKRALQVAAAGRHHVVLNGPPGCGKSMLAQHLCSLLPLLPDHVRRQRLRIHACAGVPLDLAAAGLPPLRAPHHSVSVAGLVGGGRPIVPGEVTLAHGGVLLLDEVGEFGSRRLEVLREPLQTGMVAHSRLGETLRFPAEFLLVATTNPCPCGYRGSRARACICRVHQIERYQRRLSGPLRDRIDLWVDMDRESSRRLLDVGDEPPVVAAPRQVEETTVDPLAQLPGPMRRVLAEWGDRLGLSARALVRTALVAHTIGRLEGAATVQRDHLAEALSFRPPHQA